MPITVPSKQRHIPSLWVSANPNLRISLIGRGCCSSSVVFVCMCCNLMETSVHNYRHRFENTLDYILYTAELRHTHCSPSCPSVSVRDVTQLTVKDTKA